MKSYLMMFASANLVTLQILAMGRDTAELQNLLRRRQEANNAEQDLHDLYALARDKNNKKLTPLLGESNINLQDDDGMSLVHIAVQTGNLELLRILRDYGANITLKDKNGKTPFAYINDPEVSEFLMFSWDVGKKVKSAAKTKDKVRYTK